MTPNAVESTPAGPKPLKIQNTFFDLNTFDDVLLVKLVPFVAPTSMEAALAAVGNDQAALLQVIVDGLTERVRAQAKANSEGWMKTDEDGKPTDTPFDGVLADRADVNKTVNVLARTVYGYDKDASKESKEAAKEKAMALVRGSDDIRNGLKARALAASAQS